jgi:hypothetical protein
MQPIQAHSGHTSIGSLGERDAIIRNVFEDQRRRAITEEIPILDLPDGSRVFRLPRIHGFKYVYNMQEAVHNTAGHIMQKPSHDFIEFQVGATGLYGELILRPDDPKLKNGKFEEKVAVVERLMKDPEFSFLEIVDWHKVREEAVDEKAAAAAMALTDPSYFAKVVAASRKMGISLLDSFVSEEDSHQGAE